MELHGKNNTNPIVPNPISFRPKRPNGSRGEEVPLIVGLEEVANALLVPVQTDSMLLYSQMGR